MDPAAAPASSHEGALRRLRAVDVLEVLAAADASLRAHAPGLDRLDLDVPDGAPGDTGAHLAATMASARSAAEGAGTLTDLAARLAGPGVVPVGRAGRLLAAFLRGFGDAARNLDALDASHVAMALESGADAAVEAGGEPRPGSLAEVAAAVAEAALLAADEGLPLADVLIAAADAGIDALEATPQRWEPLAEAGVVDAGAAGLLVVVDAMVAVVHGDDPEPPAWEFPPDDDEVEADDTAGRYEVTLSLAATSPVDAERGLVRAWGAVGDGVEVSRTDHGIDARVCTDDIGAVVEAAVALGRPSNIVVRDRRG